MNQLFDNALAVVAALVTAIGIVVAYPPQPRPKPEPPPPIVVQTESKQEQVAPDRIEAQPMTKEALEQAEARKVKTQLEHVKAQTERIEKKLEALEASDNNGSKRQR